MVSDESHESTPNLAVDFFCSTEVVSEGAAVVATAGSLPVDILVRDSFHCPI